MKRDVTIKGIQDLFIFSKEVKQITESIQQLGLLNQTFQSCLPPLLAQYCQIQQYRNGFLTVETSSAAAATQLRFLQSSLITKLKTNQSFLCLSDIKIKIGNQPTKLDRHYHRETQPISQAGCAAVEEAANSVSDTALADSLKKLSATLSRQMEKQTKR